MITIDGLRKDLRKIADPKKSELLQRFFKTGVGEYAEGDNFLGVMVPQSRKIAKKYRDLDFIDIERLLHSKFHEERLIALFILINKYKTTNHKKICFHFYMKNMKYINNWDLVDLSAPNIVGEELWSSTYLLNGSSKPSGNTSSNYENKPFSSAVKFILKDSKETVKNPFRKQSRPTDILFILAKSENIWERRIAVLASFQFIKHNQFIHSLRLAEILLKDKHDLIHKAVGWMLREIGKRDQEIEEEFLRRHYKNMPRTMLRYAIERFPERLRKTYLQRKVIPDV